MLGISQLPATSIVGIIVVLICTASGNSVKKEEASVEPQEIETTTFSGLTEDVLDGKFIPNFFKKWIPSSMLWDLLNFPIAPNETESSYLLTLDPPHPSPVDVSQYNLGLFEGLIDGTLPCDCGRPLGRVVNGKNARINNIPWTCALAYRDAEQPFCGATLINNRYVVTAGHCVRSAKPGEIQVWLNDENFLLSNETVGGRLVYDVIEIKKHPQYKAYFNDIALLRLNDTIKLGSREEFVVVNPVCLPVDNDNDYAGYEGTVAGWGKTTPGGKVSAALLKIKVPIWSNEECRRESKYKESIRENMICAGFKEGGTDACQGDSGGPLIIRRNVTSLGYQDADDEGTGVFIGIVSWGFGCGEPNAPGVYTRLSVYTKWILENTLDGEYCQVYSSIK